MNVDLLRRVCEAPGAPGFEYAIRDLLIDEVEPLVDSIRVDNIGNVIAYIEGKDTTKTVMVAAHMDEIGFMVRHIDDRGFIKFLPLGGFDPKTLTAQRVIVHGKKDLVGVMGVKPIHVMTAAERAKMPEIGDYYIDLGMSKEEVLKYVKVGDCATRKRELIEMGDCVNAKSMDNRAGCFVLLEALRQLSKGKKKPSFNIAAVFTVQEEVGLRGAQASTLEIQPDFSIALDVTIAFDTPGASEVEYVSRLGDGAAIKLYDGSIISDRRMVDFLTATAEAKQIKYQYEMLPAGGTDAGAMQKFTASGSITGALSIPLRNMHQVIEMANKEDVDACTDLLAAALVSMDSWDWAWGAVNDAPKPVKEAKAPKAPKAAKAKKKSK